MTGEQNFRRTWRMAQVREERIHALVNPLASRSTLPLGHSTTLPKKTSEIWARLGAGQRALQAWGPSDKIRFGEFS
jgi:hypothetical protein